MLAAVGGKATPVAPEIARGDSNIITGKTTGMKATTGQSM